VIQTLPEIDKPQCFLGCKRVLCDLGHQSNIFARREAGNQIVELKDETNVFAPVVGGAFPFSGSNC
jgi:hypothetical protein